MRINSNTILSEKDFKARVNCMIKDKANFSVKLTRDKNLYLYSEFDMLLSRSIKGRQGMKFEDRPSIFGGEVSFAQGIQIVSMVKTSVSKYIQKRGKVEEIKSAYSTIGKSMEVFSTLAPKELFYSVDINHAYFQVLHKLGYIEDKLYNLYKDQDEYKKAFHFSCSLLASRAKIYIYRKGILVKTVDTVDTDRELNTIYNNVRYTLQNMLGELYERLNKSAIAYLTDEILIRKDALQSVKDYFKEKGYEFKITTCWKVSNVEYDKAHKKTYKLFGKDSVQEKDKTKADMPHEPSKAQQFQNLIARKRAMQAA